jgi:3'(2'), 5'-bisphosphate nucleotidase
MNIQAIKKIAQQAGKEIMSFYSGEVKVYKKEDGSPITKADLASNRIIEKELKKFGYPIFSEESVDNKKRLESEKVWIVDPLDGTQDFIQKMDEFCVMIGLAISGKPYLGVIYEPVSGRLYWGLKDKGAFLEEKGKTKKLKVSSVDNFSQMTIFMSRNHLGEKEIKLAKRLKMNPEEIGSCGIKISRVAEGRGEVYINSSDKTSQWDTCAGAAILQEAGGMITDTEGQELIYNIEEPHHLKGQIVSNGLKHREIVEALEEMK